MKQDYLKKGLLALLFCAATPAMAIDFPTFGEAPQNGKTYTLISRSNPTNFMTRTSWDGAFYLMPYNVEDIKKAVFKAVKNENDTWSFVVEEQVTEEGETYTNTYYVGIPGGTDNLNANLSTAAEWTVEEGEYPGFFKIKAGEGQGNSLTIGGYLHLNAGNQYAIINESTNSWFPDYFGGVEMDEFDYPLTDETGYFPIPKNTISQNWAFVDATSNLEAYNLKIQLYQILQGIEDIIKNNETYKDGYQNAMDAAMVYYQKADFTTDDLTAAKAIITPYNTLYDEIAAAIALLGENTNNTFEKAIADAITAFNTKDANLTEALETLKAAEEAFAKSSGDLTVLGTNMSFEDLSSQNGSMTSSVAGAPTGWNVYINGNKVVTADEVKTAGISAWHGINDDSEGETKDGSMAFGLWNSGVPEYEISQTISGLDNGFYTVRAALMVGANGNGSRRTTQRIFGNLNATYFASEYDYNEELLDQNEVYGFGALEEPTTDRLMQDISVLAFVYDGSLTFGIRTNGNYAAANRENSNSAGGDGWFKVDNFRIEKADYSQDNAQAIYLHFAKALDELSNKDMQKSIATEVVNTLNQYKIDNNSTLEQIITAFTAIKNIYIIAKSSADAYGKWETAIENGFYQLMMYPNSASAGDFGDLLMELQDIYSEGEANEEQIEEYLKQIEEGIEQLKATAIVLGDITFALKNPSFEDLSNQGNAPSDGAVKAPKGWTLYVDGEEAETVSGGWCAINKGDGISAVLDDGTEVTKQPTDGDYLWGIWNSNVPEVELCQTLKNMPPGTYTVKADVMVQYNWAGDNTTTQRIFGNNCVQMWGAEESYSEANMPQDAINAATLTYAGYYCSDGLTGSANSSLLHPMEVTFGVGNDSIVKIGFRTNGININGQKYADGGLNGQGWFKVDNFRLTYDSEEIPTSINAINEKRNSMSDIFNMNGMRQSTLRKGLNIVRMSQADGSLKVKKIIIK